VGTDAITEPRRLAVGAALLEGIAIQVSRRLQLLVAFNDCQLDE